MKLKSGTGILLVCIVAIQARAQEAVLHGIITEASTGKPTAATVAIVDSNQHVVVENQSFTLGFRCSGEFTKTLPPGRAHVRVTRGFETDFVEKELDLKPGERLDASFVLHRKVDLRKRGWYSGDSHVHMLHGERTVPVSFDFVATTAKAQDLQYMSLAQAWEIQDPAPEALEAELSRRSTPDCLLTWNLEAPKNYYKGDAGRCLGHCWNVGMKGRTREGSDVIALLMASSAWDYESEKPSYANFESHHLIHEQGGAVFYTHPARWWTGSWGGKAGYPKLEHMRVSNMAVELPLDTVLGPTFDGIDVITGPGEFEANEKAFALWAMLLNHGYRLAATGSSDACFDRPGGAMPGIPRTYTYLPNGFSIGKVARATAAGRTFVTTGPLLIATLDGRAPGSEFRFGTRKHELAIQAWASGDDSDGLEHLAVFRNGQALMQCEFPNHPESIRTNFNFKETEPGWYCVRLRQNGPKRRQAITSAFYFGAYNPPAPARPQIHATVVDARTGAPLAGSLTELEYSGTLPRVGARHVVRAGETTLTVPGTVRLRAEAKGYAPLVLSPFLDNPRLLGTTTGLLDSDLVEWSAFERVRKEISNVELEFRLERASNTAMKN